MDSVASDTLKDLYVYRNGENKGFIQLMNKQKLDKQYDNAFKEYMKEIIDGANVDLIKELYTLCFKSDVGADIKEIVNQLYELNCGDVNG